jgi:predicted kinase
MRPILFVLVGLPASGKTTYAKHLEAEEAALRLTPDEWMIPLFGEAEADGKRNVVEGRLLELGLRALRLGVNVVLDFGLWAREERFAVRHLTQQAGAEFRLVYLALDEEKQGERVRERHVVDPDSTFDLGPEELRRARELFAVPKADEFAAAETHSPPTGWETWEDWVLRRWPTSQV